MPLGIASENNLFLSSVIILNVLFVKLCFKFHMCLFRNTRKNLTKCEFEVL